MEVIVPGFGIKNMEFETTHKHDWQLTGTACRIETAALLHQKVRFESNVRWCKYSKSARLCQRKIEKENEKQTNVVL